MRHPSHNRNGSGARVAGWTQDYSMWISRGVHPAVMRIPIQLRAAPEEKAGEVRGEARRCTVETCMSASRLHMAYRCGTTLGVGLGSVHGHGACVLHSLPPPKGKAQPPLIKRIRCRRFCR